MNSNDNNDNMRRDTPEKRMPSPPRYVPRITQALVAVVWDNVYKHRNVKGFAECSSRMFVNTFAVLYSLIVGYESVVNGSRLAVASAAQTAGRSARTCCLSLKAWRFRDFFSSPR